VRLVLASESRYRAELLARIDLDFDTIAPQIDERSFDGAFADATDESFALALAEAKARWVGAELVRRGEQGGAWVLAADQIAVVSDPQRRLLHKPGTAERAVEQLLELAGRGHALVTGVALLDAEHGRMLTAVDRVELRMRAFDRAEATAYVERHAPLDCVGSYRVEDAGIRLMAAIDGADPTSIIGLPLMPTCRLLREAGLLPA
jgi:7-methyl-GTP pyrophosphatase